MPFYQSQGFDLAYRSIGNGPALVLIHGWGANGSEWETASWVAQLAPGRRLLIPDLRGHGASSKPHDVRDYQPRCLAADVIALLDAAGQAEGDLFGYSLGATIALSTIIAEPNRIRSLIAGGVPGDTVAETAAIGRALRGSAAMSERARTYADYAARMGETDLQALGACLETGLPLPPSSELIAFGGEALIAAGDRDRRRKTTESLARFLPGCRFLLLEGADHMGAFTDARFKRAAVEFLDEVSPS
jgi:pimeloyl-ACP methyl ester carboxylesterase